MLEYHVRKTIINNTKTQPQFYFYTFKNKKEKKISPWHDVPLFSHSGNLNFICEIPKWTRKKYEIIKEKKFNPIQQDVKNGKLREFMYGDIMFNYGAFPQTWEDPDHITPETGAKGDNDPLGKNFFFFDFDI